MQYLFFEVKSVLKPLRIDASMTLDKDCGNFFLIWGYRLKREEKVIMK